VLAAICFLARGTHSDDIDGVALHLKTARQALQLRQYAEVLLFNIGDGLTVRADHVVMEVAVHLDAQRAVVEADFLEYTALDEEMNVFVDGCEGDCGYTLLDSRVDLFWAGVARHGLHDLVKNLALMGRGEPMIRTKFPKGTGLDAGRSLH
jgi:hypothetical protein